MDRPKTPPAASAAACSGWPWAVPAILGITFGLISLRAAAPVVSTRNRHDRPVRRGEMLRQVRPRQTAGPARPPLDHHRHRRPRRARAGRARREGRAGHRLSSCPTRRQLRALEACAPRWRRPRPSWPSWATLDRDGAQASTVASLEGELSDANRRARATEQMHSEGAVPALERDEARGKAQILDSRLKFERKRLGAFDRSQKAQLVAQKEQIGRLAELVEFGKRQVANLQVKAGAAGVVQELPLQPGQMVQAGALLAKVVKPGGSRRSLACRRPSQGRVHRPRGDHRHPQRRRCRAGHPHRPGGPGGDVRVDVALHGPLPSGARPA